MKQYARARQIVSADIENLSLLHSILACNKPQNKLQIALGAQQTQRRRMPAQRKTERKARVERNGGGCRARAPRFAKALNYIRPKCTTLHSIILRRRRRLSFIIIRQWIPRPHMRFPLSVRSSPFLCQFIYFNFSGALGETGKVMEINFSACTSPPTAGGTREA